MIYYSHFEIDGTKLIVYDKDDKNIIIANFNLLQFIDEHLDSIGYKQKDLEVN